MHCNGKHCLSLYLFLCICLSAYIYVFIDLSNSSVSVMYLSYGEMDVSSGDGFLDIIYFWFVLELIDYNEVSHLKKKLLGAWYQSWNERDQR